MGSFSNRHLLIPVVDFEDRTSGESSSLYLYPVFGKTFLKKNFKAEDCELFIYSVDKIDEFQDGSKGYGLVQVHEESLKVDIRITHQSLERVAQKIKSSKKLEATIILKLKEERGHWRIVDFQLSVGQRRFENNKSHHQLKEHYEELYGEFSYKVKTRRLHYARVQAFRAAVELGEGNAYELTSNWDNFVDRLKDAVVFKTEKENLQEVFPDPPSLIWGDKGLDFFENKDGELSVNGYLEEAVFTYLQAPQIQTKALTRYLISLTFHVSVWSTWNNLSLIKSMKPKMSTGLGAVVIGSLLALLTLTDIPIAMTAPISIFFLIGGIGGMTLFNHEDYKNKTAKYQLDCSLSMISQMMRSEDEVHSEYFKHLIFKAADQGLYIERGLASLLDRTQEPYIPKYIEL